MHNVKFSFSTLTASGGGGKVSESFSPNPNLKTYFNHFFPARASIKLGDKSTLFFEITKHKVTILASSGIMGNC
jgi:hypothetical protein